MNKKPAVLITGAGTGIGEATALLFSKHGHDIVLVGRRLDKLKKVANKLKTKAFVYSCDISSLKDVLALTKDVSKKCPHLGILVNNAAMFEQTNFKNSSDQLWADMLQTNLIAPVRLIHGLLPLFLKNKDSVVVNVASTAGLRPLASMTAYSVSKAGLIHLTQSLALEFAQKNIRFHAVCPGVVDTPIHEGKRKESISEMDKWHPLGRVGKPGEVARAIYYLACESDWMTGVILPVDGGISLL